MPMPYLNTEGSISTPRIDLLSREEFHEKENNGGGGGGYVQEARVGSETGSTGGLTFAVCISTQ